MSSEKKVVYTSKYSMKNLENTFWVKLTFSIFFFFFLKPQIKNFYMDDWLSTVALAAQNILI